jgi:hypothetical protein
VKRQRVWMVGIAVIIGLCVWIIGDGPPGLLYAGIYVLSGITGWPLGRALFGRSPAGLIAATLIGYALTAFVLWVVIAAGVPSTLTFVTAWLVTSCTVLGACRRVRRPQIAIPSWGPSESAGLTAVILLTLALAVPPLANVGTRDDRGNRYYRAYFTADFVWHTALAAEIGKFSMPPRNPYLAPQPIHYYWTYFLLPAVVAEMGPPSLQDVQRCLKVNALLTGVLLMASVFATAWIAVGRAGVVTTAVALGLVAASAEGTYELYQLWSSHVPLDAVRSVNIDAIAAWPPLNGHRIDNLPRCLWYVPQHSMAYALGLVALSAASLVGSAGSIGSIVISGIALGCSTAMNPFVGGIFALAWGFAIAIDLLRSGEIVARAGRHALAAVPIVAASGWCVACRMVEGAGNNLQFGLRGASLHSPLFTLILSLGPVLVLTIAGALVRSALAFQRIVPAAVLVVLSLVLMYFVRLSVDAEWVPFRAGQMLLVVAPVLIARWLAAWRDRRALRHVAAAVVVFAVAVGSPTTAIDAYNAHDISNRTEGPGFHWTLTLSPEEQQAFTWIQRMTPSTAIVQMEPVVRGREGWSAIPSFAERRMAAGLPISLMHVPDYDTRSELVQRIYATPDVREAWTLARRLRINFLYADALDRRSYPSVAKFDSSPEQFRPMFRAGAVAVYKVE